MTGIKHTVRLAGCYASRSVPAPRSVAQPASVDLRNPATIRVAHRLSPADFLQTAAHRQSAPPQPVSQRTCCQVPCAALSAELSYVQVSAQRPTAYLAALLKRPTAHVRYQEPAFSASVLINSSEVQPWSPQLIFGIATPHLAVRALMFILSIWLLLQVSISGPRVPSGKHSFRAGGFEW